MLKDEIAEDYPSLVSQVELTTMLSVETEMSELSEEGVPITEIYSIIDSDFATETETETESGSESEGELTPEIPIVVDPKIEEKYFEALENELDTNPDTPHCKASFAYGLG